jgi:hypothetical protein
LSTQTSCHDAPLRILALIMTFCRSSRGFTDAAFLTRAVPPWLSLTRRNR